MKWYILMIIAAILLVGCELNSNSDSDSLVKAQVLKTKIESAKIEIEQLENINKNYKKAIHLSEGFIVSRECINRDMESAKSEKAEDFEQIYYYEFLVNLKRIYELTDRISGYNEQLNLIQ